MSPRGRAWQRMLSGRRLDLLDPSPLDIEIDDIAHGLARVARWNGQTRGDWAYSVAQHSLLVTELCAELRNRPPDSWLLAALLHDAAEYVVGDLITPFKAAVGGGYKTLERRLQGAVHLRFGLPAQLPETAARLIKRSDRAAAYLEATQLAGFALPEARKLFRPPPDLPAHSLEPWSPTDAKTKFLERFAELSRCSL